MVILPAAVPLAADRQLRHALRCAPGISIMTGGQTGVDTVAAVAALRAGLVTHLVFPLGFRQENGPITAAGRHRMRGAVMHELSLAEFRYRTWTCVYLADAVLLLDPAGGDGCQQTALAARCLGRPLLAPDPGPRREQVAAWLRGTGARLLMVAGCRGSLLAAAGFGPQVSRDAWVITAAALQRHDELAG